MFRQMSLQMHTGLEEGDIVAIYTHDDAVSRRKFWLGKVVGHQHSGIAPGPAGVTCPTSGTKHPKGAAIISLQYYDFAGSGVRHDTQFVFGKDPSTYLVAASLLRCVLTERDTFVAPARDAPPPAPGAVSALPTDSEPGKWQVGQLVEARAQNSGARVGYEHCRIRAAQPDGRYTAGSNR